MKKFQAAILLVLSMLLIGCNSGEVITKDDKTGIFTSSEYSFSFSYPPEWNEITKDLPGKWAIVDANSDAILFTVNNVQVQNLALLGNFQAIRDVYQVENYTGLSPEKMDAISKIVKLQKFGENEFYTYAVDFKDKGVQSIVSGTLCGQKEVTIVLVSREDTAMVKSQVYTDLLESFACTAQ
jgi:hypothetical protein